jgi:hypothetical protein
MDDIRIAQNSVDEEIREDAARHPERTYRKHIEAAERIAAAEYRRATRAMMAASTLDPASLEEER